MKQFETKAERTINGNKFYIRPFPAFVCANLSGELTSLVAPILASATPALSGALKAKGANLLDIDAEKAVPALSEGLSAIDGDRIEKLLKKLLVKHGNISVEIPGSEAQTLTEDLVNEVFCGEVQDLYILAFDVIKANFSGFFKKLGDRFGPLLNGIGAKIKG